VGERGLGREREGEREWAGGEKKRKNEKDRVRKRRAKRDECVLYLCVGVCVAWKYYNDGGAGTGKDLPYRTSFYIGES